MKLEDLMTIDQLVDFLADTQAVAFSVISDKDACYCWIQGELVKFGYLRLSRPGKGVVIRYLMKDQRLLPSAAHPADCPVPQDRPAPALSAHRIGL